MSQSFWLSLHYEAFFFINPRAVGFSFLLSSLRIKYSVFWRKCWSSMKLKYVTSLHLIQTNWTFIFFALSSPSFLNDTEYVKPLAGWQGDWVVFGHSTLFPFSLFSIKFIHFLFNLVISYLFLHLCFNFQFIHYSVYTARFVFTSLVPPPLFSSSPPFSSPPPASSSFSFLLLSFIYQALLLLNRHFLLFSF